MALKYVVEYDSVAKIGDKEIHFKPWNTKNEKDYLIAVESEEEITDKLLYEILIKPCLKDPNLILSDNEQKMLMIQIRKKSIGSTFPMRFSCIKCGQVNDIDISFDKIVKFEPDNFKNVIIEDLEFEFGPIVSENLKDRLNNLDSNVEYSFVEFLVHIRSITINGEKEDTFTFDELKDFIENLPTYIFDEAYKEFSDMKSKLEFDFSTNCIICGAENKIDFDSIPSFLWM